MGRRLESFKQKFNQKCEEWEAETALPEEELIGISAKEWLERHPADRETEVYRPQPVQPVLVGYQALQTVNIWDKR